MKLFDQFRVAKEPIAKGELRPLGESFWQKEVKHLPEHFKDKLRKNQKYAVCFE